MSKEILTGAQIVVRCLALEKVDYVFGYPGGAVLNIYDEVFKQDKFKHVLVRHEQGAVHAADGYSRSSHKMRLVLVATAAAAAEGDMVAAIAAPARAVRKLVRCTAILDLRAPAANSVGNERLADGIRLPGLRKRSTCAAGPLLLG